MFVLIGNRHTAKVDFSTTTIQGYFGSITGSTVMQSHTIEQDIAACFLTYIHIAETYCAVVSLLEFIEIKHGILAHEHFHHLRRKEVDIVHGMVTNQHTGLRTIFQYHQQTAVYHEVYIGTEDIHQLNRLVHYHPFRYIQHKAILYKCCIESSDTIFRCICQLAIILLDQLRMFGSQFFQTAEQYTFRKMCLRQSLAIESIVHHEVECCTHVRHIALEHFIRIDRNVETVQVQAVIRSKELSRIGIFIFFLLRCGETKMFKIGKGLCAGCIHHLSAMPTNHGFALRKEVNILLFYFHHSPNSFLIQSNPRFSISNANSGPAVLTMRPL